MSFNPPEYPQGTQPPPPETPYTQVPYQQAPYQQTPPGYGPPVPQAGLSSNVAAGLAYITFIPAVIFLALNPYNRDPLIRFHSFQSIFLTVASLVIHFGLSLVLHIIPFFGIFLSAGVSLVVSLVFFIAWLIAIVQAFQGKYWKVPVLGDLAMQQASSVPVI